MPKQESADTKQKAPAGKAKQDKRASSLLLVMVAIASGFFGGWFGGQQRTEVGETKITREIVEGEGNLINAIAKDVNESVVSINVRAKATTQDIFGFGREFETGGAGTGFIISEEGYIVTNRHVVSEEVTSVTVTLADGTEIEDVEVVGRTNKSDPLDVAFVKIKDPSKYDLKPVKLGDSEKVEVGDRVVAVGNALGQFQNTVTSGIISGFGRDIEASDGGGVETLQNLFQTDAAINSGNSGGPLVNAASEVIGINVATATAENISFAIPINDVKSLIDTVLSEGKLERPYLGVRYIPLDEDVAKQLDIEQTEGAYIPESSSSRSSIIAGSPAEKAGLKEKDVIIEINGTKLDEKNTLVSILGKSRVGDTVQIKIVRDNSEQTLTAVLEAAPEQ
jgi:serine protease Do